VSRNYRILLVAVVAVLAVGGYWKLLLAPKRAQAAEIEQQVATQQAQLAQTQSLIATYAGAKEAYKTNYATVVRLGKAVPTDDDTRSLVVQLDAAAKRSGVDFDTINLTAPGGGSSASGAADATPTAPGAINAGAFAAMPFSFAFTGTFESLGSFFSRLESFVALDGDKIRVNGRLLRVETISLQPAADGWPGLAAQVGASSYIVPQSTASTTPSTTSTAPGTSSSTTTTSTEAQPG
jgi:Tfp pilus assembly protein PilO